MKCVLCPCLSVDVLADSLNIKPCGVKGAYFSVLREVSSCLRVSSKYYTFVLCLVFPLD